MSRVLDAIEEHGPEVLRHAFEHYAHQGDNANLVESIAVGATKHAGHEAARRTGRRIQGDQNSHWARKLVGAAIAATVVGVVEHVAHEHVGPKVRQRLNPYSKKPAAS